MIMFVRKEHGSHHIKEIQMRNFSIRDFFDGKLWYRCSNFAAVCAALFPENENDYSKNELLEFELGFSELGHTTFCEKCYGGSEEANPRHVEVVKQI